MDKKQPGIPYYEGANPTTSECRHTRPVGREDEELMRNVFGWNKTWKAALLCEDGPILERMVAATGTGFGDLDAIISEVGN